MQTTNTPEIPYTALYACLEAHFGTKHSPSPTTPKKYKEPDQGFRTVMFKSKYPLKLNYMQRRKRKPQLLRNILINIAQRLAKKQTTY